MQEVQREEVVAATPNPVVGTAPVTQEKVAAERVVEPAVEAPVAIEAAPVVEEKIVATDPGISVQEAFDRSLARAKGLPADAAEVVIQRTMLERYGINAERSAVRAMLNRAAIT